MKRLASFLLVPVMMVSLAACGERDTAGVRYGRIGDTLSTEWFDFVVNEAYSCGQYYDYAPSDGYKLVVVNLSLKNNCGRPVEIWGDGFVLLWGDGGDTLDIPLPAGLSGDQFPDEYILDVNASKSGVMVFEAPREFQDFSIRFMEIFESETNPDGDMGSTFYVDFTAGEKQ